MAKICFLIISVQLLSQNVPQHIGFIEQAEKGPQYHLGKTFTFLHHLLTFFSFFQSVSVPNGSQFPSSLSSISQTQSLLHSQIMHCRCSSISVQCKPIYFPLSFADSIKQCPMSTELSQREWFIAESQVFASLCEAVQCKISSFIFHIAGAASLNIPVSEHWAEDSLKFKRGIKKPVPGFEECTNIIKHILSCRSNVEVKRHIRRCSLRFPNHC